MSFLDHFDDITNYIVESKTGIYTSVNMFGFDSVGYSNNTIGPVNFWVSKRIDESLETSSFCLELSKPLVITYEAYSFDDISFATQCIGYAIDNNYDSVIIETVDTKYAISVNLDYGYREDYIVEVKGKAPARGIRIDVLLANTGKLSPDRVDRAMKDLNKTPPKITSVKEGQGQKYFRAEYKFKSKGSPHNQMGYADISQNKKHCDELFCSCSDFFYRLYAPYVKVGLATWRVPPTYRSKQNMNNKRGVAHNHKWTEKTNDAGKLFLCKHLWAFLAYYVTGQVGGSELSDEEIDSVISSYFKDVDGDGEEESIQTDFEKAFGKLLMRQAGKGDIKHLAKPLSGKKSKLPRKPKATDKPVEPTTDFEDMLSDIDKKIQDKIDTDQEGVNDDKENR